MLKVCLRIRLGIILHSFGASRHNLRPYNWPTQFQPYASRCNLVSLPVEPIHRHASPPVSFNSSWSHLIGSRSVASYNSLSRKYEQYQILSLIDKNLSSDWRTLSQMCSSLMCTLSLAIRPLISNSPSLFLKYSGDQFKHSHDAGIAITYGSLR